MLATQLTLQTVKRPMAKKDKKAKEGGEIAELKKKLPSCRTTYPPSCFARHALRLKTFTMKA